MPAAHDIYAEQLRDLRKGHPLYHPEPRSEGPVHIGDVGYVKDGAFRRLFNVSRPPDHPIQRFGVPDDFVQLDLGAIDEFDAALEPGPLHSRTISTISTEIGTPGGILPAEASFHFSCSSKRGAILMLETQMSREEVLQSLPLEAYVIQHCRSWYAFARFLGFHVGFGDLMLVTECSKTAAWSSAVYSNNSTEFGLTFSVGMPFTTAGVAASRSLEKIGPVERRRSQKRAQETDAPLLKDHTVFIKGYRVGLRQMYYRSIVSLFIKARGSGLGEGGRGGGSRSHLNSQGSTSTLPISPGSFVIGPYEPDFHASIALLALEMERNNDPEFVILHDNVWCSTAPDSVESKIMDEYTEFYFSDDVTNYLNSMLGEVFYDSELPSPDLDEPSLSYSPYLEMLNIGSLAEGTVSNTAQSTDQDAIHEYFIELVSPALMEEWGSPGPGPGEETNDQILHDMGRRISASMNHMNNEKTTPHEPADHVGIDRLAPAYINVHDLMNTPHKSIVLDPIREFQHSHDSDLRQPKDREESFSANRHTSALGKSPVKLKYTKREHLLQQIRKQGEQIAELISQLEDLNTPPASSLRDMSTYRRTWNGTSQGASGMSLDTKEIHIAVMGPGGSGKSSLINTLTGVSVEAPLAYSTHEFGFAELCTMFAEEYTPFLTDTYPRHMSNIRSLWSTHYPFKIPTGLEFCPIGSEEVILDYFRRRFGDFRHRPPYNKKSWKIRVKGSNLPRRHLITLMIRAYSMFLHNMNPGSDKSAMDMGALALRLWNLMTKEEQEELFRNLFGAA